MAKKKVSTTAPKKVVKKKTSKKTPKKKTAKKKSSRTSPSWLKRSIRAILRELAAGKPGSGPYLTAYQILEMLPQERRDSLVATYGRGGKSSGDMNAATKVIAQVAKNVTKDKLHFKTDATWFLIDGTYIEPSGKECVLFRFDG